MKVLVIFTCYNRCSKTKNAIESLVDCNPDINFEFIIVDDGSSDETQKVISELSVNNRINYIRGDGSWYYSKSMHYGMDFAMRMKRTFDYVLLINDDVTFFKGIISDLISQSGCDKKVVVGTTCDHSGGLTYGAIRYFQGIRYRIIDINDPQKECDTFNANCVLIPFSVFSKISIMDPYYIHSLGDLDYGLSIKKKGYIIVSSNKYIGVCERNTKVGTWEDTELPRLERFRLKSNPKGAPFRQWFYFLHKNFGLLSAVRHSFTPFIRIMLKK